MKRTIILFLSLALLLSACGTSSLPGETTGTDKTYDADRSFLHLNTYACETEDTVYFAVGHMLYYADKATGTGGPLCGKPECDHDVNTTTCNAWVPINLFGLSNYDGRLYFAGYRCDVIYSCAYDGTDRRVVRRLDDGLIPNTRLNALYVFHRGYVYFACNEQTVVDGETRDNSYVFAYPLDSDGEGLVILDEESGIGCETVIHPYEDELYILTYKIINTGEPYLYNEPYLYHWTIRRWSTQSRELEVLYDGDIPVRLNRELWIVDDGILLLGTVSKTAGDSQVYERNVYKLSFESGEITYLFSAMPDGLRGNVGFSDGLITANRINETGENLFIVKDFEGNTLTDTTIKLDIKINNTFSTYFVGNDETYAYFTAPNPMYPEYLIAIALDGSVARVLWSKET